MDFNTCVLCLYALGTVVVGVLLIRETEFGDTFLCKKPTVGPTYWGVYQGGELSEAHSMQTIKLHPPAQGEEGFAGGGSYSGGKAVKSARC